MNRCLKEFFGDQARIQRFLDKIPSAFQKAKLEMPRNPAVGILREQIIIAYFLHELGSNEVLIPEAGNKPGSDVVICGQELSIKTITWPEKTKTIGSMARSIKILWTVDWEKVEESIGKYKPEIDLLLIVISWGKEEESVFYIPREVQSKIFDSLGIDRYLKVAKRTNSRGITLTREALEQLLAHPKTIKCKVNWVEQDINHTPYLRWESFWRDTTD